jgi:hypothetical protein
MLPAGAWLFYIRPTRNIRAGQASRWVVTQKNNLPLSPGGRQAAPFFNASTTHPPSEGSTRDIAGRGKKMWETRNRTPLLLFLILFLFLLREAQRALF